MAVSLTLAALLCRIALGLFGLQILLDRALLGKLFFRVNTWIALALLGAALAVRLPPAFERGPEGLSLALGSGWELAGLSLYFGCLVLLVQYLVALRSARGGWILAVQRLFLPLAAAAIVVDTVATAPASAGLAVYVAPVAAVSSSFILGAVLLAMMLGHWYLVISNLSIRLLARASAAYIWATALRAVLVGVALLPILLDSGGPPREMLFWIFLTQRLLFGVVGPVFMTYFVWKTVELESTQSATGLLYVAVALVLVGEGVGTYLFFWDGVPL